jgi:hypothetical protein
VIRKTAFFSSHKQSIWKKKKKGKEKKMAKRSAETTSSIDWTEGGKKPDKVVVVVALTGNRKTATFKEYPRDEDDSYLKQLQDVVGGNIELLSVSKKRGIECYVHEEGLLQQFPQNESAAYALEHLKMRMPRTCFGLVWGPAALLFKNRAAFEEFRRDFFEPYLADTL